MGVNLRLQKRLAASVLGCGKRKIWLDPNETNEIALANSRRNIARLQRDGLIIKKPSVVHSRARVQLRNEAKRKGRHTGELHALQLIWFENENSLERRFVVLNTEKERLRMDACIEFHRLGDRIPRPRNVGIGAAF
mmetsp:Transcript_23839/g.50202  ORF Transcript_23839/g.50202 Transcript_23839/m.50202 type:complete len:136 (+) Transcript_23839:136-543(+)|eukprot:CAMPEP_0168163794 /NCGR_PEP_ID=MMETSP0139_2-20121125/572_1 /TAXON_ID=44445 /ORGANISM="Pseudo-nitzschia australis, Strain 10249 10 AB" /LENGTH=135 /DNA_ID=CAMNT_0008080725 /DNA_START=46 /DNA_END=453 /DNA_ORIENTATION=+